jgi:hypothetical protein
MIALLAQASRSLLVSFFPGGRSSCWAFSILPAFLGLGEFSPTRRERDSRGQTDGDLAKLVQLCGDRSVFWEVAISQ